MFDPADLDKPVVTWQGGKQITIKDFSDFYDQASFYNRPRRNLRFGGELSVTVPREFALALQAPDLVTSDGFQIEMTLPKRGDARLDVFDVSGRRVFEQSDARVAGRHVVNLGSQWSPGVYWVRLELAGVTTQRRVAILR